MSGPVLTLGKSAKYTIVLRNNTAAPNQFDLYTAYGTAAGFITDAVG